MIKLNERKSIKSNIIMNMILTMSSFLFPLISFPYISRILTPEGTGKVSFVTSIISYFSMFAQLGIPTYGIRACAKVRDDKIALSRTVHELLIINIIMNVISYSAFFLCLMTIPKMLEEKNLYFIISLTIILTSIGIEWLYKALEQYTYITVRSIFFKFIALILMFCLIKSKSDYIVYGAISIFASSASSICNFFNAKKYVRFKYIGDYNLKKHLKPILVFFSMSCATVIYTNLDTVMLGFMKSNVDVGYYNAAVKIKHILLSIVTSLGAVLLPRLSYYIKQGVIEEFIKITNKALHFVIIIAIPMTIYFIIYAKEGIYFLSGNEYTGAILPMQIIMPTLILVGISNITGIQMLVPLGKEKVVLLSEICGAVVDVILNLLLIPCFSASGAAIATVIAEICVLFVQVYELDDLILLAIKNIEYKKISVAIVISILLGYFCKYIRFGLFLKLTISSIIFFGVYFIILLALKDEIVVEFKNQIFKIFRKGE